MELSGKSGGRAGFLWLSFCIFLTLSCAKVISDPLKNVNLSPFQQWISAYECLNKTSPTCAANGLNLTGIIHVTGSEVTDYCNGCAQWTKDVLTCIHLVKRDFWFANNATVKLINETISHGCATNSDIVMLGVKKSGGIRNYSRTYMALFSALILAIFLFST
ncbi:uncharacterized protein LOC115670561 [Syzygium oleosum]|uniref:uncharacterized protein LOC115670561 n=1 Tax=Syzygium oleosum TaxID=219896 RepID=UPI0024BB5A1F|nr:uncharacterized protein LOC115670561 [Syzygium oleosum]